MGLFFMRGSTHGGLLQADRWYEVAPHKSRAGRILVLPAYSSACRVRGVEFKAIGRLAATDTPSIMCFLPLLSKVTPPTHSNSTRGFPPRYRHEDRPNPYDRGVLLNCAEVWCAPCEPSKVRWAAAWGCVAACQWCLGQLCTC